MYNKELFYKEGLLWVGMVLGGYGASVLSKDFYQGLIALISCAFVLVGRGLVKKYLYERRDS